MRYFFHIRHHSTLVEDPEGTEMDGIDTVRREAIEAAREMVADNLKRGAPLHIDTTFEVRDERGEVVLLLPFASVILASLIPTVPMMSENSSASERD